MTTTPVTPEVPETPEYDPWSQEVARILKGLGRLAIWGFCIVMVLKLAGMAFTLAQTGYDQLDVAGHFSHDRTLDVYMRNNWLDGENRNCWLFLKHYPNGMPTGQLASLRCPGRLDNFDNLEPHNMSVTFKGVVDLKDSSGKERNVPAHWTCTRGSDFVCHPVVISTEPVPTP